MRSDEEAARALEHFRVFAAWGERFDRSGTIYTAAHCYAKIAEVIEWLMGAENDVAAVLAEASVFVERARAQTPRAN